MEWLDANTYMIITVISSGDTGLSKGNIGLSKV